MDKYMCDYNGVWQDEHYCRNCCPLSKECKAQQDNIVDLQTAANKAITPLETAQ